MAILDWLLVASYGGWIKPQEGDKQPKCPWEIALPKMNKLKGFAY